MLHHRLSYLQCVSVEPFSSLLAALDTSLYCVIHKMMPQYIYAAYGVTYISRHSWAPTKSLSCAV